MVDLSSLHRRGAEAALVVKLMMVANDLALANEAMAHHAAASNRVDADRNKGAQLYYLRLQVSHLFEGLKVLEELPNFAALVRTLGECDLQTKTAYQRLCEYLPGGSMSTQFNDLVVRVRHNITFHYDETGRVIQRSLADLSANSCQRWSKVTRGDSMNRWRFHVADRVVDNVMCRDIWQIPYEAPLREEANERAQFVFGAFLLFLDFSGEFLWRYCRDL